MKPKLRNFKQKWFIFRIPCNTFLQQTLSFTQFSEKISFKESFKSFILFLVLRIYFDKNFIYKDVEAARILIK